MSFSSFSPFALTRGEMKNVVGGAGVVGSLMGFGILLVQD
ncbi:hypothetical protein CLV98_1153 [Dyadobacter jejuensis]|uniref:Uncharacterized protein n=1 Tax=Dyadobacter jejuensis TaxID=1082580 RepID=A0A316ADN1_9BACT|nr:hypothetical protein CLV98_1153 [Dyadobacter jejuensis]